MCETGNTLRVAFGSINARAPVLLGAARRPVPLTSYGNLYLWRRAATAAVAATHVNDVTENVAYFVCYIT